MQTGCGLECGVSRNYACCFKNESRFVRRSFGNLFECCSESIAEKPFRRLKFNRPNSNSRRNKFQKNTQRLSPAHVLDNETTNLSVSMKYYIHSLTPICFKEENGHLNNSKTSNHSKIPNSSIFGENDSVSHSFNEEPLSEQGLLLNDRTAESSCTSSESIQDEKSNSNEENWNVSPLIKMKDFLTNFFSGISPRIRGLILLNILTALYGSNITIVKEAQGSLDSALFNTGRFAIAAIAFSPWISMALKDRNARNAGIELGIWAIMGYATQALGLLSTGAGRASFLCTFTVIEVPIIAGFFGTQIPPVTWFATVLALVGVSLLESPGVSSSLFGDFWCLISALFFGIHMLRSEHHSKHMQPEYAVSMIGLQMTVMAIASAVWSSFAHKDSISSLLFSAQSGDFSSLLSSLQSIPWGLMIFTGVISTACCLWIELVTLRNVSASEAAMVYSLEPLYGAFFAWVLLGERWGLKGWFGAMLVVGGSLSMQIYGGKNEKQDYESQVILIEKEFDLLDSETNSLIDSDAANENKQQRAKDEKKDA